MKRILPLLVLPFALAACQDTHQPLASEAAVTSELALSTQADGEVIPGQYIVVFRDDVSDVRGLAQRLIAEHGGEHRFTYTAALRGFAARLPDAAVGALRNHPSIQYIEQDQVVRTATTQTGATWGIDRIDQSDLPLSTTYQYEFTGAGVTAYIIDTGIRLDHQEFTGRMVGGFDAVTSGGTANDCNGHGTHVAGTVGGTRYGVAKAVKLSPIRVLDCGGGGTTSGVIAGVDWVTANHVKPAVANMSLGGSASTSLDDAVKRSIAAGVVYGLAAGNGNFLGRPQDACNSSPARVAEGLTVGSTTSSDNESSFSNFGKCVNILAPGSSITSAWHTSSTSTNTISGTSMATPHVIGVAALYLEKYPTATPAVVGNALTSNASLNKISLHTSSKNNSTPNRLLFTGFIAGGGGDTPPPVNQAPKADFTYSCSNETCSFTDRSSDADGSVVGWSWNFGNGSTSSLQSPSTAFSSAGSYTVTQTVTDNEGATGSASKTITCQQRARGLRCS
jgi:subtilisin family serine protease